MKKLPVYVLAGLFILTACSENKKEEKETKEETITTQLADKPVEVEVMTLKERLFHHELICNGKITAQHAASIRFQTAERIAHIWVKNGDRVRKGQKLAELDLFKLERRLAQAKDVLEQSKLDLQDVLIGRGYPLAQQNNVPAEEMELAKVKSGYNKAVISYELAADEIKNATLTAPFDGVVANLFSKANNTANTGEAFCTIIDNAQPEVSFTILESELPMVNPGYEVTVAPFSSIGAEERVNGVVTEVNPQVESNGMVKVKARVRNNGKLLEGMNVKVTLRRPLGNSLVIPKNAVVMRSGKAVVFTLNGGDKVQWNYVQVEIENADSCTIAPRSKDYEGLSAGDTVVVSGNLNLAHDAPVVIKQK